MRQILHISDIHFGPYFVPAAADAVRTLAEERGADLLVVSGDVTQRAKPRQFRDARRWLDGFSMPWVAVPGNHDVPMYRVWERVFAPYGAYREHFDDTMEPVWQDDELYVVGVNTAFNWTIKDGRFTRESLLRVAERLEAAPPGRVKLVVAHHHLIPPPRFDTRRVTALAREATELFADLGVDLVLSGHLHQSWIGTSEEFYPRGARPVVLVHTGTTTSRRGRGWERRRCSANWIRVERDRVFVSHLLWHPERGAFVAWSRHEYPRGDAEPYVLPDAL
ncbi:MAG: metallophosphoesterase family protein [Acidobacteriota bacterium]